MLVLCFDVLWNRVWASAVLSSVCADAVCMVNAIKIARSKDKGRDFLPTFIYVPIVEFLM